MIAYVLSLGLMAVTLVQAADALEPLRTINVADVDVRQATGCPPNAVKYTTPQISSCFQPGAAGPLWVIYSPTGFPSLATQRDSRIDFAARPGETLRCDAEGTMACHRLVPEHFDTLPIGPDGISIADHVRFEAAAIVLFRQARDMLESGFNDIDQDTWIVSGFVEDAPGGGQAVYVIGFSYRVERGDLAMHAYMIPDTARGTTLSPYAASVDEIELAINLDLFAFLLDTVEAVLEGPPLH